MATTTKRYTHVFFDIGKVTTAIGKTGTSSIGSATGAAYPLKLPASARRRIHHGVADAQRAEAVASPAAHYRRTTLARPRKMKNPMLSVTNVSSTLEPNAGSRPAPAGWRRRRQARRTPSPACET